MPSAVTLCPQFFTATILNWHPLLDQDPYKKIITDSLSYLVCSERIIVYCFVLMPTHLHIIWQMRKSQKRENVQRDFLKYTAYQMLKLMKETSPANLSFFEVNAADRKFQIWERNSLSIDLYSHKVFLQKMNYIHNNPLQPKWKLCYRDSDYYYSSAASYRKRNKVWDFLTLYTGM